MSKISVEIVTPEKKLLNVEVEEAKIPGFHGLFGVRAGHTPFLSLMQPGVLSLLDGNSTQNYFVAGGFVEVGQDDTVCVLADAAEPISAIDVAAAQKRLEEAQSRLKGLSVDDVRFEVEQATVRRETARVSAGSLR